MVEMDRRQLRRPLVRMPSSAAVAMAGHSEKLEHWKVNKNEIKQCHEALLKISPLVHEPEDPGEELRKAWATVLQA